MKLAKSLFHLPKTEFVCHWLVRNGHQFDVHSVSATAVFVDIQRHSGVSLWVLQKHVEVQAYNMNSQRWLKYMAIPSFS